MKHSTRAPTKYEAERIEAMKRLGCVACAVLGVPNLNALELHHILDGGVRMGHFFTIFLCRGHHQGDWSASQHVEDKYRVAISDGRKLFNAVYGTERELWERVQTKLKLTKVWPVSKRVPREGVRHVARPVLDAVHPVAVEVEGVAADAPEGPAPEGQALPLAGPSLGRALHDFRGEAPVATGVREGSPVGARGEGR